MSGVGLGGVDFKYFMQLLVNRYRQHLSFPGHRGVLAFRDAVLDQSDHRSVFSGPLS